MDCEQLPLIDKIIAWVLSGSIMIYVLLVTILGMWVKGKITHGVWHTIFVIQILRISSLFHKVLMPANLDFFYLTTLQSFSLVP